MEPKKSEFRPIEIYHDQSGIYFIFAPFIGSIDFDVVRRFVSVAIPSHLKYELRRAYDHDIGRKGAGLCIYIGPNVKTIEPNKWINDEAGGFLRMRFE